MSTPKGMRAYRVGLKKGGAVHVYSDDGSILLQLRHSLPSEEDVRAASFKVCLDLSSGEALELAGELLMVAGKRLKR